jgi:hypothetical protein
LWSGVLFSIEVTCISTDCVKYTGWVGGLSYALFIISCWCIMMVTFPGYSDIAKFTEWYENTYYPILKLSIKIWGVLNIVSTIATIVGIYKMIHSLH